MRERDFYINTRFSDSHCLYKCQNIYNVNIWHNVIHSQLLAFKSIMGPHSLLSPFIPPHLILHLAHQRSILPTLPTYFQYGFYCMIWYGMVKYGSRAFAITSHAMPSNKPIMYSKHFSMIFICQYMAPACLTVSSSHP